jgi:hypothetical protein
MTWRVRAEERAKQEHVSPRTFVVSCLQLDEKDNAFAWLEKTIDEREPAALQLKIDPQSDSLRSDPRYPTLLKRMKMTP